MSWTMLRAQMDSAKKAAPAKAPVSTPQLLNKKAQEKFIEYHLGRESSDLLLQQKVGDIQQQLRPNAIIVDPSENTRPAERPARPVQQQRALMQDAEEESLTHRLINGPNQFDSRVEIRSINPNIPGAKDILRNARSVAVVVDRSRLVKVSTGYYQLDNSRTLGQIYQLCPGEAFKDQPVVGTGTAFVTGKHQMLTASHVFTGPLTNYAVVFGFELYNQTGALEPLISTDSVYFPKKITATSAQLDASLFETDRDLPSPPLTVYKGRNISTKQPVYMIGHPYGLPKKMAGNASVLSNNDPTTFYTSLDAFQGNSGSPVFDLATNALIGVLVGGETDFNWNGSCNVSTLCKFPYCQGEKVIRITALAGMTGFNYLTP